MNVPFGKDMHNLLAQNQRGIVNDVSRLNLAF